MTELVWVSLLSVSGSVLVAFASALATIFGPAARERALKREEQRIAANDLRYDRAYLFIEALSKLPSAQYGHEVRHAHNVRNHFIATLRPGEGAVEKFTAQLLAAVTSAPSSAQDIVNDAAEQLFGWLRGDVDSVDLAVMRVLPELR